MNTTPANISPRQPWTDWLLVLAVGVLLLAPTVDYFARVDRTRPPDENRLLAPWPQLTQRNLRGGHDYMAGMEAYFNDHFGFRKRLIRWCQQWRERLYKDKSVNRVIAGPDGWYYITEAQMIDHYLGLKKFTPEELQSWQRLLEKRRDWLAARGIGYLFVIAPDKQTIYPEHLPAWLVQATPAQRETKLDQFGAYMKAHSTVNILDLRAPLLAHKQDGPLYLENDTHWNFLGAFVGAQEVVRTVSRQMPQLPPLRQEDFMWSNAPATGGDLTSRLDIHPVEKNNFICTPRPPLLAPHVKALTNIVRNWNNQDRLKVNRLVENQNPIANPVDLVIFHDSYAGFWYQFFGCSFHRNVFVFDDQEFNTNVVNAAHPQIVINEMLERLFETENPDEMFAREALP